MKYRKMQFGERFCQKETIFLTHPLHTCLWYLRRAHLLKHPNPVCSFFRIRPPTQVTRKMPPSLFPSPDQGKPPAAVSCRKLGKKGDALRILQTWRDREPPPACDGPTPCPFAAGPQRPRAITAVRRALAHTRHGYCCPPPRR
jgi:hypothetical protein